MKIVTINLDSRETPTSVLVEMTLDEAILIGNHVGNLVPSTEISTGIWHSLTGSLFNRFWDDGIREAGEK